MITSKSNTLIKKINSLKEKKYRLAYGEYIIEGYKQIREAISSGQDVSCIIFSSCYNGDLSNEKCAVEVSDEVFAKLSEEKSPQGVLAVLKMPHFHQSAPEKYALLLDGVSDPGNLGTIIRTANGAGYSDIYLRNCTDPFAPKCVRSAMSGIFFVRLHVVDKRDIERIFSDIPMICADMEGEDIYGFSAPEKFCLVIGNEANGVSAEIMNMCRYTLSIPMRNTCESLNAGVSAGIMMYQLKYSNR